MIINDLDGYYIVFDTKNWNTELDTLLYYTIPEAMKLYGLSQDQIYKRIKKYAIEKVKIGKYIKISKRDLEKAIGKPKVI